MHASAAAAAPAAAFSPAERLKFGLLAGGIAISDAAMKAIQDDNGDRPITPADYASTSGVILALDDDVWVNAPVAQHNPNFVTSPEYTLEHHGNSFVVHGKGLESSAQFWLLPRYHGGRNSSGELLNHFVFTHGDRVRLSPITGCAMRCKFCNIPYEDRYAVKSPEAMIEAVSIALRDSLQPARHVLVSGGTPVPRDVEFLRDVYRRVLLAFPGVAVDIMMVPVDGLFDLPELAELGVNELSINLEIFNGPVAADLMRHKYRQGIEHYLAFLAEAAEVLGPSRVRSMLLVGLEPMEDTLAGVRAIAERGCVPVLSPFRPDPVTPLRSFRPPSAAQLAETYLRAMEITSSLGVRLGPTCPPCSHNTLTLFGSAGGPAGYPFPRPTMI